MTLDGAFADNVAATSGGVFEGHYTNIGGYSTMALRTYNGPAYGKAAGLGAEIGVHWNHISKCKCQSKGDTCCISQ